MKKVESFEIDADTPMFVGDTRQAEKGFAFIVLSWKPLPPSNYHQWRALDGFYHIQREDTGERLWVEGSDLRLNSVPIKDDKVWRKV